jgi:hypothetical protein
LRTVRQRFRDVLTEAGEVLFEGGLLREALQCVPGRRLARRTVSQREAHLGRAEDDDAPEKTTVEKRPEDFRA